MRLPYESPRVFFTLIRGFAPEWLMYFKIYHGRQTRRQNRTRETHVVSSFIMQFPSRSFMTASLRKQPHCRCLTGAASTLPTECPQAETSTHLESASASHRGAAASLLHQLELHGGIVAQHIAGAWLVGAASTLPTECQQAETSTHLESASASHRRAG